MKRSLVIAPIFFGYEKTICKELTDRGYTVDFIDQDGMKQEYWECWDMSFSSKVLRHVIPGQRERDRKKAAAIFTGKYLDRWIEQADMTEGAYEMILTVKGDFVPDRFYELLREKNPEADMVLYLWDDIGILNKTGYFRYFDKVLSYNIEDCRKMDWTYLPIFLQNSSGKIVPYNDRKYDIAMIGTGHRERIRITKRIYNKYKDRYSFFIYFVRREEVKDEFFTHKEALSYEEYSDILADSRIILDIPLGVQEGPTTRVFDAQRTETKVITVNRKIKKYPVYGQNVAVVNELYPVILDSFVKEKYVPGKVCVLNISEWFDRIIE